MVTEQEPPTGEEGEVSLHRAALERPVSGTKSREWSKEKVEPDLDRGVGSAGDCHAWSRWQRGAGGG
jgi:hypothetical protein